MSMIIPTFSQEFIQEVYDITMQNDDWVFFAVRSSKLDDNWFIYTTEDGECPLWYNNTYVVNDGLVFSEVLNADWEASVYWHDAN